MQPTLPQSFRDLGIAVATSFLVISTAGTASAAVIEAADAVAASVASERFSVEVIGQGPDVVLIPGLASSREVWRPLAQRLSATHRVHLVQLAGFAGEAWGHQDGPFVQPVVDGLAVYVAGLSQPAVIGHSMGGFAALVLAQQHPELVGSVMLVDSLPFYSAMYGPQVTPEMAKPFADQAAAMIRDADEATFRQQQTQMAGGMVKTEAARAAVVEWSMSSDRAAMASAISEVMTTDVRPQLSVMTTPIWAVYAADADGGAQPPMADALWSREYAALPGVRLIRVNDSRHFIMIDQAARLDAIVDEFLTLAP